MKHEQVLAQYVGHFVDQLFHSGVKQVVISPGSRSTPLALAFANYEKVKVWVDIDERSAGFFALGIAKESKEPVALLCSSGTAAANYFPAIIESHYSRVPLIVLTADRPHELREIGAPQAIDQIKLFGEYVKHFQEMALPEATPTMLRYVRNQADRAVQVALAPISGPVHVNFPFREPLVPDFSGENVWGTEITNSSHTSIRHEKEWDKHEIETILKEKKRVVIIAGPLSDSNVYSSIFHLAESWNIPILADPLSQLRNGSTAHLIESYDALMKSKTIRDRLSIDLIIRFGAMPVAKPIHQLMNEQIIPQIIVDEQVSFRNPSHQSAHYIYGPPSEVAEGLASIKWRGSEGWMQWWQDLNGRAISILSQRNTTALLTEGDAVLGIHKEIPEQSILFAGNSMPIRDLDTFWISSEKSIFIAANRGANGIDGIISTAIGMAAGGKRVTLIIGDISFLHGMNGLLLAKRYKLPITIVVVNNNGGGIFSFLPQAKDKETHFDLLFGTPQEVEFEKAAEMFGVAYEQPTDWEAYLKALRQSYKREGCTIIELQTTRDHNVTWHREKWQMIESIATERLKEIKNES